VLRENERTQNNAHDAVIIMTTTTSTSTSFWRFCRAQKYVARRRRRTFTTTTTRTAFSSSSSSSSSSSFSEAKVGALKNDDDDAFNDASLSGEFVPFAIELAEAANGETLKYWRESFAVETKGDESPVTIADKNAESAMRKLVKSRYPSHAIFGEEHGIELGEKSEGNGDGHEYLWVFDPIDGTKSFITGKPLWGTLIALLRDGEPVLGVLEQPVLKERWIGCKGTQTTFNGNPVSVHGDEQKALNEALMYSTTPLMFYDENEVRYEQLKRDVKIPMFGCDCYAYGLLASGFCDIVCEADLKPYDYMALVPIVLGAGGKMTDWEGEELKFIVGEGDGESFQGEVLATASERLWKESLASLKRR